MTTIPISSVINNDNLSNGIFYFLCKKFKYMDNISILMFVPLVILALIVKIAISWVISSVILFIIYRLRGFDKSFSNAFQDMKVCVLWTFFVPFIPILTAFTIGLTGEKTQIKN